LASANDLRGDDQLQLASANCLSGQHPVGALAHFPAHLYGDDKATSLKFKQNRIILNKIGFEVV